MGRRVSSHRRGHLRLAHPAEGIALLVAGMLVVATLVAALGGRSGAGNGQAPPSTVARGPSRTAVATVPAATQADRVSAVTVPPFSELGHALTAGQWVRATPIIVPPAPSPSSVPTVPTVSSAPTPSSPPTLSSPTGTASPAPSADGQPPAAPSTSSASPTGSATSAPAPATSSSATRHLRTRPPAPSSTGATGTPTEPFPAPSTTTDAPAAPTRDGPAATDGGTSTGGGGDAAAATSGRPTGTRPPDEATAPGTGTATTAPVAPTP